MFTPSANYVVAMASTSITMMVVIIMLINMIGITVGSSMFMMLIAMIITSITVNKYDNHAHHH